MKILYMLLLATAITHCSEKLKTNCNNESKQQETTAKTTAPAGLLEKAQSLIIYVNDKPTTLSAGAVNDEVADREPIAIQRPTVAITQAQPTQYEAKIALRELYRKRDNQIRRKIRIKQQLAKTKYQISQLEQLLQKNG